MEKKEKKDFPQLPEIKVRKKYTYITFFIVFFIINLGALSLIWPKNIDYSITQIANISYEVIACIILLIILKDDLKRDIKYYFKNFKVYFKFDIKLFVLSFLMGIIANIILITIFNIQQPENEKIVRTYSLFTQIILGCLIAPFVEECIYRGLLKKFITNKYLFIIVSCVCFALIHVFGREKNVIGFLNIFRYAIDGFLLAYNYQKTNNLTSSIIMHIMLNTFSVAASLMIM